MSPSSALPSAIERLWRAAGTGLFLAVIGIGGTVMACTIFPLLALVTRDPVLRRHRIQSTMRASLRLYCTSIRRLGIAHIDIVGSERAKALKGTVVIANHLTLLDVVMILSVVPNAQCVVKAALWRSVFFRLTLDGAGYIRNDLTPEALVEACVGTLVAGNNLVVFPEGTRAVDRRLGRFHRGFATIAILARADLQLMRIVVDPIQLHKGNPWWRVPERRARFTLEIGERLDVAPFLVHQSRAIAARRLAAFAEAHYVQATT